VSADTFHALGCLLGGAFGDSLGAAVEFMPRQVIIERFGPEGILWPEPCYGLPAGVITDDTQQAIAVGEGLIRAVSHRLTFPAVNQEIWISLKAWHATQVDPAQRRAPGNTSMAALQAEQPGSVRALPNTSNSCGAVMRCHPIGVLYAKRPVAAFICGEQTAALTHGGREAWMAAGALASLVSFVMAGESVTVGVDNIVRLLRVYDSDCNTLRLLERAVRMNMDSQLRSPNELGQGWESDEALAIAVYCALRYEEDFLAGVRLAVNIDGDSDSTGSICGAILGARLGIGAIPREWAERIERRGELATIARTLAAVDIR
jgi:ADP-ribosylglycohydrolase